MPAGHLGPPGRHHHGRVSAGVRRSSFGYLKGGLLDGAGRQTERRQPLERCLPRQLHLLVVRCEVRDDVADRLEAAH